MAISIDHIAVPCREPDVSARFFGDILGVATSRDGADDEFFCLRFERGACLLWTETAA